MKKKQRKIRKNPADLTGRNSLARKKEILAIQKRICCLERLVIHLEELLRFYVLEPKQHWIVPGAQVLIKKAGGLKK